MGYDADADAEAERTWEPRVDDGEPARRHALGSEHRVQTGRLEEDRLQPLIHHGLEETEEVG
ncbi:MAG: hypothetical protein JRN36_00945 [Nitrososphaerota archaeon]|nr:hypothetical protein [Nitrososphaerota archaeon]